MLRYLKLILIAVIWVSFTGCSDNTSSSEASDEVTITVLDGYIAQALVSDANGKTASYSSKGVYTFSKNPEGIINVKAGFFEDSYLINAMNLSAEINNGVISPITSFLAAHPDLESAISLALGVKKETLLGDYIAAKNLELAKFSQIIYTMDVNGLEADFVAMFGKPTSLTEIFSTALMTISSSGDPDIQNRRKNIEAFLTALETYNGNANELETSLLAKKILMQNQGGLRQTGQYNSYDVNGDVISDGSLKDDGYYQSGMARYFTRSGVGIVTDYSAGLVQMWQDNSNVVLKPWITQENADAKNYDDTSGDTAVSYCSNLTLGGYNDWRLPTVNELRNLADYGNTPALESIFQYGPEDRSDKDYWSATTFVEDESIAWSIEYFTGKTGPLVSKANDALVRCIRGGSELTAELVRNDTSGIVTDQTTQLMWQDNTINAKMSWTNAFQYCETLTDGGYDDWRLPNVNELNSIVDYTRSSPAINPVFQYADSSYYWSSTSSDYDKRWPLAISFVQGFVSSGLDKGEDHNIRCIRG